MMSSMEAARAVKSAASWLESCKRATLEAAVVVADAVEGGAYYRDDIVEAYGVAKDAELEARVAYFDAVEKRLEVVDYVKQAAERKADRRVSS